MQAALDMQSGVVLDPMAEFFALGQHPDQGNEPAIGVTALTLSVKKGEGKAAYAPGCTDTDAVGMACEQVTGVCSYITLYTSRRNGTIQLHKQEQAHCDSAAVLAQL